MKNLFNRIVAWLAGMFAAVAARNFDALAAMTGNKTTQQMGNEVKAIIVDLNNQAKTLLDDADAINTMAETDYEKAVRLAAQVAQAQRDIAKGKTAEASQLLDKSADAAKTLEFFGIN